ncbi:MAG: sulfatase-like hydrolase/transferase [Anaerolineales bacterium]|nr:sulfatase-like hydrolase/transferase [Anaerolineales bacterium]
MKHIISRRDFLKLAGLLSLGFALPRSFINPTGVRQSPPPDAAKENVLIIVFDAWSATNMSLYGYGRPTTPNIEKLARKAIVYHNHYSTANFTNPGTASLLTGTLPWTHRAFEIDSTIGKSLGQKSVFHAFPDYHRLAYSHNPAAQLIMDPFSADIEDLVRWSKLYLDTDLLPTTLLKNDEATALVSWNRALKRLEGYSYSLYLSTLYTTPKERKLDRFSPNFPRGLPSQDYYTYFILEHAVDFLIERLSPRPQPFLGYYHFFPPHSPYRPRIDFYGRFDNDDFRPVKKPDSVFRGNRPASSIQNARGQYDEFILYVDDEFARLYQFLEENGFLENTWLILTSDHGEMFERGIQDHITQVLYQPIVHIPLLIFPPGAQERVDIYESTSAVDLLPTLTHITGHPIPEWIEGVILPPFAPTQPNREIYCFHGAQDSFGKIYRGTAALIREQLKAIWYFNYDEIGGAGNEVIELFDLAADPEELNNLYPTRQDIADELVQKLRAKTAQSPA